MRVGGVLVVAMLLLTGLGTRAQPVFTGAEIFPPEEFAGRRARVMAAIGDAVAIIQGTTERPGEQPFRQNNQFFYLCGVTEPRGILVVDGRTRRSTLFLAPRNERREQRMFGPGLSPGDEAARVTGLDAVLDREGFSAFVSAIASDGRTMYAPFRPEVLGQASSGDPAALWKANAADPWDGRPSREAAFVGKLKAAAPGSQVRDLDPVLDDLRAIKSPREIAIIREATAMTGQAIVAAMREARPGLAEYALQAPAEFVFKKGGAYGSSYFALIATGRNTYYSHYHKNTAVLQEGDLVQFDYGPDYKYYTADLTRVFPASGRFTPRQRELYTIYLRLYQSLMSSIRVHATAKDVIKDAVTKMDAVMASFTFTDSRIKTAAAEMVERFRSSAATRLGHFVGMEVHDVSGPNTPITLEPGMVFTIEPQLRLEDEHLGIRLEDMILITDTGYENLSAFVPLEIADIERTMKEAPLVRGGTRGKE